MRERIGRTVMLVSCLLLLIGAEAAAQGNWRPGDFGSLRFRLGMFEPDAESTYWEDSFRDFTGSPSDFEDASIGFDYAWPLSDSAAIQFGIGHWSGEATQAYRDWVDADGRDIAHLTSIDRSELSAALVYHIGGRDSSFAPYIGAGGGFVWWRLEETGDFIDFGDDDLPIVTTTYESDDVVLGTFLLAGLEVRLAPRWSFFAEGRWLDADDELGGEHAGLGTLDLSGREIAAGLAWHF